MRPQYHIQIPNYHVGYLLSVLSPVSNRAGRKSKADPSLRQPTSEQTHGAARDSSRLLAPLPAWGGGRKIIKADFVENGKVKRLWQDCKK